MQKNLEMIGNESHYLFYKQIRDLFLIMVVLQLSHAILYK